MMPRKPKHPCSYPGCPKLTDKRFCEEHEKLSNSNYEKYGRDKSTKKRYGRAWKRIRDKYAAEHPFCELCFERGIIVPTEEIHHKLPLKMCIRDRASEDPFVRTSYNCLFGCV